MGDEKGMEDEVIQTNPILEAFGNAMTARNNNSSRFGKWLDLQFLGTNLQGCTLTSYLLETTRVCGQTKNERGFHIFFQMLHARSKWTDFGLRESPKDYNFLKVGQLKAPGIDDGQCFEETWEAFGDIGFDEGQRTDIFRVVAAVLAIGNCDFEEETSDSAKLMDDAPLKNAAELLKIDLDGLKDCILYKVVLAGRDVTRTKLRKEQANAARDAMARLLYGRLFAWLIAKMNQILASGEKSKQSRLLGVLDLAGFESFEMNSLEQLMINVSNEHLQQHYNKVIFKDELDECCQTAAFPTAALPGKSEVSLQRTSS